MSGTIVAPRQRDLDELSRQLGSWLACQMPQATELRVANLSYPSGAGMSHETILFDACWKEGGRNVTEGLVARVKPTANMVFPDDLFTEQYRLMRVLHENKWVPVAEPRWIEQDDAVVGAPFFIMRKLVGRLPISRPPYAQVGWIAEATPAQRARLWENGVRMLASVQRVPLSEVSFLEGKEDARSGLGQEREKYVFQQITQGDNEYVFRNDTYLYGIRARVNAGFGLWQLAFGSAATLDATNYAAARAAMMNFKSNDGRILGVTPTTLVVPPALEDAALHLLNTEIKDGGGSNPWKGTASLIVTPYLS